MASDPITTLSSYVTWLEKHPVPAGKVAIFRGLADTAFDLRPSVFRNDVRTQREHLLLRELIAAHPADFAGDASALEQLVRMQHFSLPTRLLDVTWNPLAALWFATEPFAKEVSTGKLTKRGKPAVKGAVDAGRPWLRRRLVQGRPPGKGRNTLLSRPKIPDRPRQIRQAPLQKPEPYRNYVRPAEGLASCRHSLRSMSDRILLRCGPRRHRHLLALINES
ncbi:hypothetical protein ABIC16_004270 [Sphingomonas sp. PvP055]